MLSNKYVILYLIVLILIPYSELYSDETCESITNCPDKPYKYRFCNEFNRQLVEMCESDPNNVSGFTPMKATIPLCFEFQSQSGDPTIIKLDIQVGGKIEVFDISKVQDDIDNAQYGWNCLCGKENDECVCIVKVKFISDNRYWPPKVNKLEPMVSLTQLETSPGCKLKCPHPNTSILLNNLPGFKQKMLESRIRSFSNQEYIDVNGNDYLKQTRAGLRTYNLTDIMYQAIGLVYGLRPQSGDPECNPPYEGRMGSGFTMEQGSQGLSRDDKCMFKKLYCPALTPVEEEIVENSELYNYPNPFNAMTSIEFSVPEKGAYIIMEVYNSIGQLVDRDINKFYSGGVYTHDYDGSALSAGVYYYVMRVDNIISSNTFAIVK